VILLLICSTYCSNLASGAAAFSAKAETEAAAQGKAELTTNAMDLTSRLAALESQVDSLTSSATPQVTTYTSSDGVNLRNYVYRDNLIFQDIFDAYNSNIFQKIGTPGGWDETSYSVNPWNGKRILNIGTGVQRNGNGMRVNIPQGYDVMWIRILGDRWCVLRVDAYTPNAPFSFTNVPEIYAGGFRNLNKIAPDGAGSDSYWNVHEWMPIPIRGGAAQYNVYSAQNSDSWISGIGFGKNLWNHAAQSAVAYLWKLNTQTGDVGWTGQNCNNDQLAQFNPGSTTEVSVPVVYSGKDKMIYLAEHNNNWVDTQHTAVYINGHPVERFRTTYVNPFSVHIGSKIYNRYIATRIPANLIAQGDKFVHLKVDCSSQQASTNLYFREIGTHDVI